MAENKIPLLPPLLGQGGSDARRDQQELDILDLDAKLKRLAHREIGQRYSIKWIAIGTGTVVILGMFGLLA